MLKFFVFLLPLTAAFYSKTFFKNGCVKDLQFKSVYAMREALFCENVFFSSEDQQQILEEDFILSDEDVIYFVNSDLGKVNHDFFSKFPLTRKMVFHNVTMKLTSSANITADDDFVPLENLMILNSRILDNINSNAFHSLVNLKNLDITQSSFQNKVIDTSLFRNCVRLSLSNIELSKIENGAFSKLSELETIQLIGLNLTYLNPKLLKKNTKLQQLNLKDNLFSEIPSHLPESLEKLGLVNNKIESLSRNDCKDLKNLKELYLSYNLLSTIERDTFDDMVNLEVLNLGSNRLTEFDKAMVKNLVALKSLYLEGNLIEGDEVSEMFMYAGYEP